MSARVRSACGRSCSHRIASRMRRSHSTVACRWAISASRTITLATADQGATWRQQLVEGSCRAILLEALEAGRSCSYGQLDQARQVARLRERELEVQLLAQRRHRASRTPSSPRSVSSALGVAS